MTTSASARFKRGKGAFASVPSNRLEYGENPVAKLPLIVTGYINRTLHITVLNDDFEEEKEGTELSEAGVPINCVKCGYMWYCVYCWLCGCSF